MEDASVENQGEPSGLNHHGQSAVQGLWHNQNGTVAMPTSVSALPPQVTQYPIQNHAGPMKIPNGNSFCGVCGLGITLEDEQHDPWGVDGTHLYHELGQSQGSQVEDDDDNEFEESEADGQSQTTQNAYQNGDDDYIPPRRFGPLPNPGWTCFYRVIIRRTQLPPCRGMPLYHLSGIGRYQLWDTDPQARKLQYKSCQGGKVFTVPWAKDDSLTDRLHFITSNISLGGHKPAKRISVLPANFHDESFRHAFPHGFPIHAHCWTLVERVIGPIAEQNLDLFVEVLQNRWMIDDMITDSRAINDWLVDSPWRRNTSDEYEVTRNLVAIRDPIATHEVQELMAESARLFAQESDTDSIDGSPFDILPYEILHLILNHLHYDEVDNFEKATKIPIGDTYWHSRLPKNIITELRDIDYRKTKLNLRHMCLKAERLCHESYGLMNRQRICNLLERDREELEWLASLAAKGGADERTQDAMEGLPRTREVVHVDEGNEEDEDMEEWTEEVWKPEYEEDGQWDEQ